MFRFTIRELLLLTALVATSIAWSSDRAVAEAARQTTRQHAERLRESLAAAKGINGMLRFAIEHPGEAQCWQVPQPDWELASKPIP
jgi:hypothetical protein